MHGQEPEPCTRWALRDRSLRAAIKAIPQHKPLFSEQVVQRYLFVKPMISEITMPHSILSCGPKLAAEWWYNVHVVHKACCESLDREEYELVNGTLLDEEIIANPQSSSIPFENGIKAGAMEFHSKVASNALYGLIGRHFLPNLTYDSTVLEDFREFSERLWSTWWPTFEDNMVKSLQDNEFDPMGWLSEK